MPTRLSGHGQHPHDGEGQAPRTAAPASRPPATPGAPPRGRGPATPRTPGGRRAPRCRAGRTPPRGSTPPSPAKARTGDEGGHEAVPGQQQGRPVGQQRDHQHAEGATGGGAQSAAAGTTPAAHRPLPPTTTPATTPSDQLDEGVDERLPGAQPLLAGDHGDREQDDRRGQAVVEPALHVERPSHAGRDDRVEHRGGPQPGVGRGQGCRQEQRHHDGEVGEQDAGDQVAEQDRQGEPDEQQAGVERRRPSRSPGDAPGRRRGRGSGPASSRRRA